MAAAVCCSICFGGGTLNFRGRLWLRPYLLFKSSPNCVAVLAEPALS